jgi:hypothetical protein
MTITVAQMSAAQAAYDARSEEDYAAERCAECGEIPGEGDCVLCALIVADIEDRAEARALERAERGDR